MAGLGSTWAEIIKAINNGIDLGSDYVWAGDHEFQGEVDFSQANVIGLNVGGGVGKTKITVAQLQSLLSNYSNNVGKLIQFVYKGQVAYERTALQAIGTINIGNHSSMSRTVGISSASQSSLSGTNYTVYVSATEAYLTYNSWDFDIANDVTNNYDVGRIPLTDAKIDIYVIGE